MFLTWLWEGAVVAMVTAGLLGCLARARARHRYLVCAAAWMIVLLLPLLDRLAPTIAVPSSFASSDAFAVAPADAVHRWNWSAVLVVTWCAWMAVTVVAAARAIRQLRRISAAAVAVPSSLHSDLMQWQRVSAVGRRARLVASAGVDSAGVLLGRPPLIALAPATIDILAPDALDQVVLHEWAHVQRRDDLANLVLIAGRVIAGWHPAIWWLTRRLAIEREIACDEMVVERTGGARCYAACLTELATRLRPARSMAAIPGVFSGSLVARRVVRVLRITRLIRPAFSGWLSTGAVAGLCGLACVLVTVELVARPMPAIPRNRLVTAQRLDVVAPGNAAAPLLLPRRQKIPTASGVIATPSNEPVSLAPQAPADSPPQRPPVEMTPPIPDIGSVITATPLPSGTAVTHVTPSAPPPTADISPWQAAANSGVAIGRGSQKAAVATAGFFTRFARRVGDSFKE